MGLFAERRTLKINKKFIQIVALLCFGIIISGWNVAHSDSLFDYYVERGQEVFQEGEVDQAMEYLQKAISSWVEEDTPAKLGFAYYNLGLIYGIKGEYSEALQSLNKSIELNPDDHMVYTTRAHIYRKLFDYQHAIDDYTKAIELKSNFLLAYYNRANAYKTIGKYEEAVSDLLVCINKEKEIDDEWTKAGFNLVDVYSLLWEVYFMKGELDSAITSLKTSLKMGETQKAYLWLAKSYNETDNKDELSALAGEYIVYTFSRITSEGRESVENDYDQRYTAEIFIEIDLPLEPAVNSATKAVEYDSMNAENHYVLGRVYLKSSEFTKAKQSFEKALKFNPNHDWALLYLGDTYVNLKNEERAESCWQKILNLNPRHRFALERLRK